LELRAMCALCCTGVIGGEDGGGRVASCGATVPRARHMWFFNTNEAKQWEWKIAKKKKKFVRNASVFLGKEKHFRPCLVTKIFEKWISIFVLYLINCVQSSLQLKVTKMTHLPRVVKPWLQSPFVDTWAHYFHDVAAYLLITYYL